MKSSVCLMLLASVQAQDATTGTVSCGGIGGLKCPSDEYECDTSNCPAGQTDCLGECVVKISPCANLRCAYACEVDPVTGEGRCTDPPVPSLPTCANTFCIATTTCKDHPTKGAVCVPIDLPTCALLDCLPGMDCKDDATFGAECTYNCMTKEVWTPEKSEWCCANQKLGCPVPAPVTQCGGIAGLMCPDGYDCKMECPPNVSDCLGTCVKPSAVCVDGETKQVDCNMCTCANGQFSICTLQACECKDGETTQRDCNTCTCEKGMFQCTEKACVAQECGGIAGIPCPDGFECDVKCDTTSMTDCMGTCKSKSSDKKVCKSNDDCEDDEHCRTDTLPGTYDCSTEKYCVKRVKKGSPCGGFTMPCMFNICESDAKCVYPPGLLDAPGICSEAVLSEGDVCRIGDPTAMFPEMDRSTDCPTGSTCQMTTNSKEWRCSKSTSTIERCTTSSCDDDEVCFVEDGKVKCKSMKINDCDLDMEEEILCSSNGMCKDGYECTGCQEMCKCDPAGGKICTDECRPTCKKVKASGCLSSPVAQWKQLGCETFSCFASATSPSEEQQKFCCEATGRFCKEANDMFDCKDDPKRWSYPQRKWCCEEKNAGCPVAPFDCSIATDALEVMKNADGLFQTSFVDFPQWEPKQAEYCCAKFGVGCDPNVDIFDCDWNLLTAGAWSEEQSEWCCAVKGKRCPRVIEEPEDLKEKREKCQVKKDARMMWDEDTRKMCCLIEGIECKADKYDCYGDQPLSQWTKDQKEWCCDEMYVACEFDCRAESDLLAPEQKEKCCDSKGLHCPETVIEEPEPKADKKFRKPLRFLFKGAFSKIKENPKKFLRKFRKTILKVAKSLKSDGLLINFIGGLMKGNVVPTPDMIDKWGTNIPSSWNRELFTGEFDSDSDSSDDKNDDALSAAGVSRNVITLGADTVSELNSVDEGAFVDLEISDNDAAALNLGTEELTAALDQSKAGTGPFRDNNDGSTLIMEPVGEGMTVGSTASNTDSDSSNTGLVVALAILSSLCVGGMLIAGVIMHKKRQSGHVANTNDGELLTFEKVQANLEQDTCRV